MIASILQDCWKHDVVLSVVDGNIQADYQKDNFPDELRIRVKENKASLIERIKQNELLKSNGWIVVCFGEMYEYHLSLRSYLYIEREEEQSFSLWRNTEKSVGEDQSKVFLSNASFNDVYAKAVDYIAWWKGRQQKVAM